uniref:SURF1-like protein n=1 Tax=Salix viminalis TaxID=40686 RepID=A0A6N2KPP1_SALVM
MASMSRTLTRNFRNTLQLRSGGSLESFPKHWILSSSSSSPFCSSAAAAAATISAQPQEKESGSGLSKWLLFLPGAISFGLGTWQVFRRQDKIKMLEYRQGRLAIEPMKFNDISPSSEQFDDLEFRRVACKGVFNDKMSIYVGPRSRSISGITENGYYIITPLMPSPILVNRGWVPRSWKDKSLEVSQNDEQPSDIAMTSAQGSEKSSWWKFGSKKPKTIEEQATSIVPVVVVGVVRGSEKPSIFVPENDPSSFQWFYVDVPAIARACGLPENTIYVEDINENFNSGCPYPVPKDVNALIRSSVMPQDHLNYTLTWYSLSAAVTFMAFKRLRPKKSQR